MARTEEIYSLREEDRPFVAAVLRLYAKHVGSQVDDISLASGEAGVAVKKLEERALRLADEVNPPKFLSSALGPHGSTYPKT